MADHETKAQHAQHERDDAAAAKKAQGHPEIQDIDQVHKLLGIAGGSAGDANLRAIHQAARQQLGKINATMQEQYDKVRDAEAEKVRQAEAKAAEEAKQAKRKAEDEAAKKAEDDRKKAEEEAEKAKRPRQLDRIMREAALRLWLDWAKRSVRESKT